MDRAWTGMTIFRMAEPTEAKAVTAATGRVTIEEEGAIQPKKRLNGTILQPSTPGEPVVGTITSIPAKDKHVYYVHSWQGAEQEPMDEVQSRETTDSGYLLDITAEDIERLEGKGATAINPSDIERMTGEERANWIAALEAELNSLINRDV